MIEIIKALFKRKQTKISYNLFTKITDLYKVFLFLYWVSISMKILGDKVHNDKV